jgi:CDP-4-dehydro-6-deoxyglucose reductase
MRVTLKPASIGECFCEFTPGQYIELWQPQSSHLSRSYSIANSPHGDGSIELHIRRVEGGRFTQWAFDSMKPGDQLQARGPLGGFTMRSPAWVPLLFVAGGTGIAPVLALLEQQVRFDAARNMILIWGMRHASDFYALDSLREMLTEAPNLRVILASEIGDAAMATVERLSTTRGIVTDTLRSDNSLLAHRDIYVAGPPMMLRELSHALGDLGVDAARIHIDSFGV